MTRDGEFEALCDICGKNCNDRYCSVDNSNFMDSSMSSTNDCDDFEFMDDYEDDDDCEDDDDDDCTQPIDCPNCHNDAYWNGSEYECGECGWVGR